MNHSNCGCTRRQAIRSLLGGSLLLPGIVSELLAADQVRASGTDPLAPQAPHFPSRAQRVIFLYLSGGVSHVDSFDPKPKLVADRGKKGTHGFYKAPDWDFAPRGQCGTEVSDLFPHMAGCVDDFALIRSMRGDHANHLKRPSAFTGSVTFARPSLGSWVSYGLGTVNRNLPSFVVLAPQLPYAGPGLVVRFSSGLPSGHACPSGTRANSEHEPAAGVRRIAGDGAGTLAVVQPQASTETPDGSIAGGAHSIF
jgi:hypothetical protein